MANAVFRATRVVSSILRSAHPFVPAENSSKVVTSPAGVVALQIRLVSYLNSPPVRDLSEYPEVEIVKNPPEWKYVEKLFPQEIVPQPKPKTEYPSGWKPPQQLDGNAKYYIARTKNHMIPVYLHMSHRNARHLTVIRRIQGDIWSLEKDLRQVVEKARGRLCASRVNELSGQVIFHGDYVNVIKDYLEKKGF